MRVFAGTNNPGIKYQEDITITISPSFANATYVLGQPVNFDKVILYWMGSRAVSVDVSDVSATLEFNLNQNIIARRNGINGTTVVNAKIIETY